MILIGQHLNVYHFYHSGPEYIKLQNTNPIKSQGPARDSSVLNYPADSYSAEHSNIYNIPNKLLFKLTYFSISFSNRTLQYVMPPASACKQIIALMVICNNTHQLMFYGLIKYSSISQLVWCHHHMSDLHLFLSSPQFLVSSDQAVNE